ncbi:MAG TPA: hypothetical protein VIH61_08950, partial [Waddliaceae bacterium]
LKLFIGFVPDEAFQTELQQTNPYLISLFIGREEYLQEIVHKGRRYLGKYLSSYPTFDQLEDMEKHVLSLLNHLAPRYPFSTNAFVLITCDGS